MTSCRSDYLVVKIVREYQTDTKRSSEELCKYPVSTIGSEHLEAMTSCRKDCLGSVTLGSAVNIPSAIELSNSHVFPGIQCVLSLATTQLGKTKLHLVKISPNAKSSCEK